MMLEILKNIKKQLGNIDYIIHLAAITDAANSFEIKDQLLINNLESTKVIANYALKKKIPLIFPSSTSIYGPQANTVDETSKELNPQSPYADCKLQEEKLLNKLSKKGLNLTILRLGTIFGISTGMRFHTAVNKFCWQASLDQPITVWETAYEQVRPYLDLDDAARAISHIIDENIFIGETYNVVTGNYSVKDVIDAIKSHKESISISYTKSKIMNQLSYHVLANKIAATGFTPHGSLQVGIAETLALLGAKHLRVAS